VVVAQVLRPGRDLVHPDDVHRLKNAGTDQCMFVRDGYLKVRMKCADGKYRRFEYRAAFVMDENDKPRSMMGSFSPILEHSETWEEETGPKFLTQKQNSLK